MQKTTQVQRSSPSLIMAVLVTFGLTLAIASAFSTIACFTGLLFGGASTVIVVFITVVVCTSAISVTASVARRKKRHFGWRALIVGIICVSLSFISLLSWIETREEMQIFLEPGSAQHGVHVRRGRSLFFGSYVCFTGKPAIISSLLKSKGLIEIPAEPSSTSDLSGYSARQYSKVAWDWWQPISMVKPRFFYLHHTSKTVQGWSEGWWVNGETNQVYAYISD